MNSVHGVHVALHYFLRHSGNVEAIRIRCMLVVHVMIIDNISFGFGYNISHDYYSLLVNTNYLLFVCIWNYYEPSSDL